MDAGESWLNAEDVSRLLECYGIPALRASLAASPGAAARLAQEFGVPIALKIASPDITHKSDVGGVALDLKDGDAVRNAAEAMLARVAAAAPEAKVTGFVVQEIIRLPGAYELIAGMTVDRQFGPVILFGHSGTAAEIIADRELALPPLNLRLAHELIAQTRIFRQLQGYRDRPRAALEEIALTLVKLSQLICDLDEVVEIDLNPLLADVERVVAVDARIRLERQAAVHGNRLAIRPYPKELERQEQLSSIGNLKLRPIRPEDAPMLGQLIADLTPEDARFRFFTPVRSFDPSTLARFTQIDYVREMAFVAFADDIPDRLLAVVRLAADPNNIRAEFAIVVRSDMHRRGLRRLLLAYLVKYPRNRGISELFEEVLAGNRPMIALCSQLGFTISTTESPDLLRATLDPQTAL